jgi:hypothetical protein
MRRLLWALALLFVSDWAFPMAPGAFQFEGQSVEVARRLSLQAAAVVPPPSLQPRSPVAPHAAPRISMGRAPRREVVRTFAVQKSPQESEAPIAEADPPLPS